MKKYFIIVGCAVVLMIGLVSFSIYQTAKLNREYPDIVVKPVRSMPALTSRRPALQASRPEDYGMVVTNSSTPVLTQGYWDDLISQKARYLRENASKEALDKINQNIKEDPIKLQENLKQIEDNIKKYSAAVAKNPNDQESKDRLEHFLIYKSIARELPQE